MGIIGHLESKDYRNPIDPINPNNPIKTMTDYQKNFIEFLLKAEALKFGEFTLKSGRVSPYFFNAGLFNTGEEIEKLGFFYSSKIKDEFGEDFNVVFGPSYKGIPMAVATSIVLNKEFNLNKSYLFDRKEVKDHADKSAFVGYEPKPGEKIIILDDVMTTGKTKEEAVEKLKTHFEGVEFKALVIAFNRLEKDKEGNNAIEQFENKYKIPVKSIITIKDVLEYLPGKKIDGQVYMDEEAKAKVEKYLEEHGV